MQASLIENQDFKNKDFTAEELYPAEFESCIFTNCNFSQQNLGPFSFIDCKFENCDFSLSQFAGTTLRDVLFSNCKLMGLRFDACNPFLLSFEFQDCILDFSSFYKLNIKGTHFSKCRMRETDFTETNLSNAVFDSCDLSGTTFSNSILQKADLRTSQNFSIDPEVNSITAARFSRANIAGLLGRYKIIIEN
ncbi:pentapeptide repeat-containing protein [Antarcticibacterium arcticum]|uniref:Pentapeptide repeat-containing protein n=2 Tax=Antarcticibacterium arcticum TaxID=2585771 RepID=A0A5B8YQP8_9FLAO|nr:pentapeptide repeat-containing protein [Antarcticibacterium arcticum]